MSKRRVLCIDIDTGHYASFIERIAALGQARISSYVCVANVHMVVEAHHNPAFAAVVNGADLVTPDGMPVAKSIQLLHGFQQDRVAGMTLVPDLIAASDNLGLSLFIYGSTDDVLAGVLSRITLENPRLKVAGAYSPPFRMLSSDEEASVIARINASGANIVLVALGCPKQERWMAANRGSVDAVMVGIGGALPVYAGLQSRAPLLMQSLSLEWLYRLCQEPRRLFTRYLVTNTTFLLLLSLSFFSNRKKMALPQGKSVSEAGVSKDQAL